MAAPWGRAATWIVTGCLAVAAASLLAPWTLDFDPWGWVLWGRELGRSGLGFSTVTYPSWKPLPAIFTTVFSLAGKGEPALWLVVARAGSLLALAMAWRLAARLGGRAAGPVAAVALLLAGAWLRLTAGAASDPLFVALLLWAIDRHFDGRPTQAFCLGALAGLDRPEAWPFIGVYGLALAWRRPSRRPIVAAGLLALPVLWFGGDWLGSGDPFRGGYLARTSLGAVAGQRSQAPVLILLGHLVDVVIAPVWAMAAVAIFDAWRRADRRVLALAGLAAAWAVVIVATTALGYAGVTRFLLPTAALASVLAGVGTVHLVALAGGGARRLAAAALILSAAWAPFVVVRSLDVAHQLSLYGTRVTTVHDLVAAVELSGGRAGIVRCGHPAVNLAIETALAWQLGVPTQRLDRLRAPVGLVFRTGHTPFPHLDRKVRGLAFQRRRATPLHLHVVGHVAYWNVLAFTATTNGRLTGPRCRRLPGRLATRDPSLSAHSGQPGRRG